MTITQLIDKLPTSVKLDVVDFEDVKLKDGRIAVRVLLDRLLTDEEKELMTKKKNIIGINCVATYKYAPEIKKSYFYIV